MRCIYKVLFTRVHPRAEKVNAWGKCSPRCSPFGNYRQRYDKRLPVLFQAMFVHWHWGVHYPLPVRGCVISLDNSWCITVDYRMHNRCCACVYQLLCKRTTAVVRPKILTVSTTYPISSNNLFCLFQQHILSLQAIYSISFNK